MNLQELFDKVVKPLLAQGRRAYDNHDEVCYYRAPCGAKCAVGQIITDEYYSETLENQSIDAESVQKAVAWSIGQSELEPAQYNLLEALQGAHDDIGILTREHSGEVIETDEEQLQHVVYNFRKVAAANGLIFDEEEVALA